MLRRYLTLITGSVLVGAVAACGELAGLSESPLQTWSTPADAPTLLPESGLAPAALMFAASATPTAPPSTHTPTPTEVPFAEGQELTIDELRSLAITGSPIIFEQRLASGPNFERHIVSYLSEGTRINGLLTIPFGSPPEGGYKAIVFNHGYIPPASYRTTGRYEAYVNYLARSGFVVFKIDYRGHGDSEGQASGSYFSPGYTLDATAALRSLQTLDFVDREGIGMWGHSMAGNLVLRAMLIEADIQAGVIWAGAVYSYDDFARYGIDDRTYRPPATVEGGQNPRRSRVLFELYGTPDPQHPFWRAVSLTANLGHLTRPLQLHRALDDTVVNIGYSRELAAALQAAGKPYAFYEYEGGGHNLISPFFEQAMRRTVAFFIEHL